MTTSVTFKPLLIRLITASVSQSLGWCVCVATFQCLLTVLTKTGFLETVWKQSGPQSLIYRLQQLGSML